MMILRLPNLSLIEMVSDQTWLYAEGTWGDFGDPLWLQEVSAQNGVRLTRIAPKTSFIPLTNFH